MKHDTVDRRMQQRCVKDVSMTCAHVNENDDRLVTVRNYSSTGVYFESEKQARVDSFVVIRTAGSHDGGAYLTVRRSFSVRHRTVRSPGLLDVSVAYGCQGCPLRQG